MVSGRGDRCKGSLVTASIFLVRRPKTGAEACAQKSTLSAIASASTMAIIKYAFAAVMLLAATSSAAAVAEPPECNQAINGVFVSGIAPRASQDAAAV